MEMFGGGLIYLSIAYSGGVLMFIYRFRRGLVTSNPFHVFLHEHLWEQQSDLQLLQTIYNKDA